MSKPRIRGTTVIFLVLGGFWILFLVSAHLILDLEEGNDYFRSLRSSKFDQRLNNIKDAEGILKFKSVEGKKHRKLRGLHAALWSNENN